MVKFIIIFIIVQLIMLIPSFFWYKKIIKKFNFSKELGGVVPNKINFATMSNNQIISLAVDRYAIINQRETKPNGELFNVTDFVEPKFRKSRNPFGSLTVDGPSVTGNYNGVT